jgi:hypothetical protein
MNGQEFMVVISRNHRGQFPYASRMTPNKSARGRGEELPFALARPVATASRIMAGMRRQPVRGSVVTWL